MRCARASTGGADGAGAYFGEPPALERGEPGGYIYLIKCHGRLPHYKIGITKNPMDRINDICHSLAYVCELLHIKRSIYYSSMERTLHAELIERGKHV